MNFILVDFAFGVRVDFDFGIPFCVVIFSGENVYRRKKSFLLLVSCFLS